MRGEIREERERERAMLNLQLVKLYMAVRFMIHKMDSIHVKIY